MRSLWDRGNRWLTWFHRWAGVVLCLLFAMWFASGAVLHFVGFPALSTQDRHQGSADLNFEQVTLSPAEALAKVPNARDLRLLERAGHAAYLAQTSTGEWTVVSAQSGALLSDVTMPEARSVAESFGMAPVIAVTGPFSYDQWIVHQHFDPFRPFYRVRLNDAQQTDLYVSARTGEVLQRTRFAERAWNWVGAVVHWIYFTPLRQSWSAWNQVVWWVSLAALISITAGTWLGVIRMLANRAAGRAGLSPFRGWMRWHHLIGLFASVIVITWMLSGWLSMDHGRIFSMGHATDAQESRLSGMTITDDAQAVTVESLRRMAPAAEIAFNAIDDQAFLTAYEARTGTSRVVFLNDFAKVLPHIPNSVMLEGVKHVWPNATAAAPQAGADGLYRHAESTGQDAEGFVAEDGATVRAYVDRLSGRFLVVMDLSRRSYAWIYYGLHTLEFPGLIEHPALRTCLVLFLLALGFLSSATGVVLSVKRLRREFA
jgi:hypothetical protein